MASWILTSLCGWVELIDTTCVCVCVCVCKCVCWGRGRWWGLSRCYVAQFQPDMMWNVSDKRPLWIPSEYNIQICSFMLGLYNLFFMCWGCMLTLYKNRENIAHSCIWTALIPQRFPSFFFFYFYNHLCHFHFFLFFLFLIQLQPYPIKHSDR